MSVESLWKNKPRDLESGRRTVSYLAHLAKCMGMMIDRRFYKEKLQSPEHWAGMATCRLTTNSA